MAGLLHEHNLKYDLILNTFGIHIAYVSLTGKKLKRVSLFVAYVYYRYFC